MLILINWVILINLDNYVYSTYLVHFYSSSGLIGLKMGTHVLEFPVQLNLVNKVNTINLKNNIPNT